MVRAIKVNSSLLAMLHAKSFVGCGAEDQYQYMTLFDQICGMFKLIFASLIK